MKAIEVSLSMGFGIWHAGEHDSMFSVIVLIVDKLTSRRDTVEVSAELWTLMVSTRKDTAPKENTGM